MNAQPVRVRHEYDDDEAALSAQAHELTDEEAIAVFDENARYYLGMSGDEFRRK